MSEPGFASLGPSLLARKGGAKPAMRPQVAPLVADEATIAALAEDQLEDLGWNDMGDSDAPTGGADIVPINADMSAEDFVSSAFAEGGPIVRRQQRRLEDRVLADAVMTGPDDADPEYDEEDEPVYGEARTAGANDYDADDQDDPANGDAFAPLAPVAEPAPIRQPALMAAPAPRRPRVSAAPAGRRAAFTLRLDADRHLKLRLAATMQGVSAQALVTQALDRMLADYDNLDAIAHHLTSQIKRH